MNVVEAGVLAAYAAKALGKEIDVGTTARIWQRLLADIPAPLAQAAIDRVLTTSYYWPTPAQIREAAEKLAPRPDEPPAPEIAWEWVRKNIDFYKVPDYPHPLIKRAAEVIGQRNLCGTERDMFGRFMGVYQALLGRHKDEQINKVVIQIQAGGNIAIPGAPPALAEKKGP